MNNQENTQVQESTQPKVSDKELNFRAIEAKLTQERAARLEAEKARAEMEKQLQERNSQRSDDEDDSEPYVDHKKLNRKLDRFGQNTQSEIQKAMEQAKQAAKDELKQEMWMENKKDFYDVMQLAEKFAERAPELANSILRMPEGFERQKLVYENIKALGIDKPQKTESSVQQKIDANRKNPYYQPSAQGTPAYSSGGDFSPSGQKNAWDKLQELKRNIRL